MSKDPQDNVGPNQFYVQALLLAEVVKRILSKKADIDLAQKPTITLNPIVEFRRRMRVSGLGKLDEKTFISTINFFANEKDEEKEKALGTLIIYIGESFVVKLFQAMKYPVIDEDEEAAIKDACGTFCNLIAGNFKSGLTQLGYKELIMSHFSTYENEILNGVLYPTTQSELYEVSFHIRGTKRIVAELVMGPLVKADSD